MPHPTRLLARLRRTRRRGSILILVVALVVLLALIGTAYLSTTQTERYTSAQNTINTEADLQMQGLVATVNTSVGSAGLFGRTTAGVTYRPPSQEMPTYDGKGLYDANGQLLATAPLAGTASFAAPTGYSYHDGLDNDLFLGNRTPTENSTLAYPTWGTVPWPLYPNSAQTYPTAAPAYPDAYSGVRTTTSPAASSLPAAYKNYLQYYPIGASVGGQPTPGAIVYLTQVPAAFATLYPNAPQVPGYITPAGFQALAAPTAATFTTPATYDTLVNMAADADGDGIADSLLFPMPGGPIAGITYYAAYRIVDGNSAVNASTAYTSSYDFAAVDSSPATLTDYGFFRSNVGLQELAFYNTGYPNIPAAEIENLNYVRLNSNDLVPYQSSTGTMKVSGYSFYPIDDTATAIRTDFGWYSVGDMLENQLARRIGNPGYVNYGGAAGKKIRTVSVGLAATASLAYRFGIQNPAASPTLLEQALYQDLTLRTVSPTTSVPTMPYAVGDLKDWFNNQFYFDLYSTSSPATVNVLTSNMPLRSLVVGNNAVSDAVPARYGNASGPPAWTVGKTYAFGDWVTDYATIATNTRSYVCIQQHVAAATNRPGTGDGVNPGATPFWAGTQAIAQTMVKPGMPWTRQPVKTSINTASFEQLWLGFAQVMTDVIGADADPSGGPIPLVVPSGQLPQWQPPMQPSPVPAKAAAATTTNPYPEQQMPMFRSVTRDPVPTAVTTAKYRLTSSQMLKLRAAVAAVNTIDLRDSDDDVTSRRVILTNPQTGLPQFDVEVFGTERQPFIGSVYVHVDTATAANDFIAIQLVNPYDEPITLDPSAAAGWRLGTVVRTAFPDLKMTDVTATLGWTTAFTIPAKTSTTTGEMPGIAVIQSGTPPAGYMPPTNVAPITITNLQNVLTATTTGGELYLMKPRQQMAGAGVPSSRSNTTPAVGTFGESYAEATNIGDLVPVDQVDFTNLVTLAGTAATADYYYRRGTDQFGTSAAVPGLAGWHFVYPGPYIHPSTKYPYASTLPQGFATTINTAPTAANPLLGSVYGYIAAKTPDTTGVAQPLVPTFQTYPVVLNNTYMAGVNRLQAAHGQQPVAYTTPPAFPFGGFARAADMYAIPFIGAYRIRFVDPTTAAPEDSTGAPADPNGFLEMNSVSEDSSLAEDVVDAALTYGAPVPNATIPPPTNTNVANSTGTATTDAPKATAIDTSATPYAEQIGRFCPVGDSNHGTATPATFDFSDVPNAYLHWHYHWANRLFDYFAVQAPSQDYFANVDPTDIDTAVTPNIPAKYYPLTAPTPVANNNPAIPNAYYPATSEDTVGVEGLININTAPWPVLASLPLVPAGTNNVTYTAPATPNTVGTTSLGSDPSIPDDRIKLAKAIVDDRNANGPFKSIADLYRVQAFRSENDAQLLATPLATAAYAEPGLDKGIFSPAGFGATVSTTQTGRPRYDFQDRFLLLNRISNLITTRSDTFTCYVLLQGYRNVGVPGVTPTLVVQRRQAYLVDRNGVTPQNQRPTQYPVPSN